MSRAADARTVVDDWLVLVIKSQLPFVLIDIVCRQARIAQRRLFDTHGGHALPNRPC